MSRPSGVRLAAEVRHQSVLIARDPGPLIGYTVMGLLLITATRPLYAALSHLGDGIGGERNRPGGGRDGGHVLALRPQGRRRAAAQRANLAHLGPAADQPGRLRRDPGRQVPADLRRDCLQQALLFGFAAAAFGLHPRAGWWALAACGLAWSGCVLFLGVGASTLARSPAQLSAAGDVFALLTTVLGGALVPVALLPGWMRSVAPASPGYWALDAYRSALAGTRPNSGGRWRCSASSRSSASPSRPESAPARTRDQRPPERPSRPVGRPGLAA